MALLGAAHYDPAGAVSKSTASLLAMAALDTANLRVTFTAPANGKVLVRMRGTASHGATTWAQILFGVLEASTVRGRMAPIGAFGQAAGATSPLVREASFLVTGLTPGNSYTYDAAYGVEFAVASSNLKYGGPNDASGNDAWGAFAFEVWETHALLAGTLYDPASAATKATSSLTAMAAMDTSNLRLTFAAPPSGRVLWRIAGLIGKGTSGAIPSVLIGVMESASIRSRTQPVIGAAGTALATSHVPFEAKGYVGGLTPANNYTYDAAWATQVVAAASVIEYGGPNDTTQDNAYGGLAFEVWSA